MVARDRNSLFPVEVELSRVHGYASATCQPASVALLLVQYYGPTTAALFTMFAVTADQQWGAITKERRGGPEDSITPVLQLQAASVAGTRREANL